MKISEPDSASLPLGGTDISGQPLEVVHKVYLQWFGSDYDLGALDCVLCAAAAERLGGDPPWLLIVGGSGAAKTETIMPLSAAGAHAVSTINGEAALLSGTPKKERAENATGGLLREIGHRGVLVIKDMTSILSMNRDTRNLVLGALREIYDGRWSRRIGGEGGQSLNWEGRIVVIGGVTTAWDSAHQVVATMGDRFLLVRLKPSNKSRLAAGRQAMNNVNSEIEMREHLAKAVGGLLTSVDSNVVIKTDDNDVDELLVMADLVTRARTAVERDFQGKPLFAHALEMPTRFAKQLLQLMRGGIAMGMPRERALTVAIRAARDSLPPMRLAVLGDVAEHPLTATAEAVKRLQLPRTTVDRTLQELHLLGLLVVGEVNYGQGVRWVYSLAPDVESSTVEKFTRNVTTP